MTSTVHDFLHADSGTLPHLPDESVHLVVTSPPYPMIAMWDEQFADRSPEAGDALAAEDGDAAFEAMHCELDRTWEECARLLVPGGIIAVNVGDAVRTLGGTFRLYSNHSRIINFLTSLGLQPLPLVIWNKPTNAPNKFMGSGMLPGGAYVTLEHEYILIARKGGPRRPRNEAGRERRRRSALFWEERNVWFSDIWRLGSARQTLLDPADRSRSGAFPLELPYRLIAMYSWQEDRVLDPFAGTGTTALAAMALGRASLSVELSDDLLSRAVTRALDPAVGEVLRKRNQRRLEDHRTFLTTRDAPKHRNRHYGFPVITAQETDLQLPLLAGVTGADHLQMTRLQAAYEDVAD